MIATTKEQSARLIACGVDPKTADMCWCKVKSPNIEGYTWVLVTENYLKRRESDEFIPAWGLSELLSLLPDTISALEPLRLKLHDEPNVVQYSWWLRHDCGIFDKSEISYSLSYQTLVCFPSNHPTRPCCCDFYPLEEDGKNLIWSDESPIEVCVQAIEWLTRHDYQLNLVNNINNSNEDI